MIDQCRVVDSGFAADGAFKAAGAHLDAQMMQVSGAADFGLGKEAMFAVLAGGLHLTCTDDGETHQLTAGEGLLVPQNTPVSLVADKGTLLYVVRAK